jgi:hypothetical protein
MYAAAPARIAAVGSFVSAFDQRDPDNAARIACGFRCRQRGAQARRTVTDDEDIADIRQRPAGYDNGPKFATRGYLRREIGM